MNYIGDFCLKEGAKYSHNTKQIGTVRLPPPLNATCMFCSVLRYAVQKTEPSYCTVIGLCCKIVNSKMMKDMTKEKKLIIKKKKRIVL